MEETFKQEEIEDVRIIIKANGKNYALTPKKEFGKEVAKQMRLLLGDYALQMHAIVTPALDDIKQSDLERASADNSDENSGLHKHAVIKSVCEFCINHGWEDSEPEYCKCCGDRL
jgi:hypothetical protein